MKQVYTDGVENSIIARNSTCVWTAYYVIPDGGRFLVPRNLHLNVRPVTGLKPVLLFANPEIVPFQTDDHIEELVPGAYLSTRLMSFQIPSGVEQPFSQIGKII